MIQILCHPGHSKRGKKLATRVVGSHYDSIASPAVTKKDLDTLIFWGHGESSSVCKLTPIDLAALIKRWKKKNKGLNTVEIITCNAQHFAKPFGTNSFVNKLKIQLKAGFLSSTRNIKVKALPRYKGGAENAWSILLADHSNESWCYVSAPGKTDKVMFLGSSLITFQIDSMGKTTCFKGDIATRAHQVVNDPDNFGHKWTMLYGHFKDIRSKLVEC